jgi:hypothetical protein
MEPARTNAGQLAERRLPRSSLATMLLRTLQTTFARMLGNATTVLNSTT